MKLIRLSLIITILILFLIIGYLYVSESFIPLTDEEKNQYTNFFSQTPANVFFLNPPPSGGVDPKTGIKKGSQIKYDCQTPAPGTPGRLGTDCKFDLRFP
jgi:hypothetical protein